MKQQVIISESLQEDLAIALSECHHDKLFVLVDEHTYADCWPVIRDFYGVRNAHLIIIKATDTYKNIETLAKVWKELGEHGGTRHSSLINLGGGMVTDLGGFAASTFKRGIDFINIPTTLLAMVDASVGGKTGINFNGLKNEVGVFNEAKSVILNTSFLKTLDNANLRSGYAEMLKHGLISDEKMWAELLLFDLEHPDLRLLQQMVASSVKVKERIVESDPLEHGIRKALNFGHTIGHAFESFSMKKGSPLLHGYAVAYGMVCELYLSCIHTGFSTERMRSTVNYIKEYYGKYEITCDEYKELLALMKHDKKNISDTIVFTLLNDIGDIKINQVVEEKDIEESLDFFREN